MRNILFIILATILFSQCTPKAGTIITDPETTTTHPNKPGVEKPGPVKPGLQTDPEDFRAVAPEPGPARKIELGTYESFKLDNGLKVIVVENHKVPRVSFQLSLDLDPIMEGEAAGYSNLAGDLLSKGTITRTKAQLDEELDFLGASLSTNAYGFFASSLTKHVPTLLDLATDVLLNPSFPQDEFDKLITQTKSAIISGKDDPQTIAGNVASVLNYGKDHPYGELVTEETVSKITLQKCTNYYKTYFKPNIAYLVIVGDITVPEARTFADKYFGKWKKGEVHQPKYRTPLPPKETNVAFVDKAGAVQSVINVTYPVELKPGTPDVIPASVMNGILGGGVFSGRLMQNLREDKGFTYGSRSSLSYDKLVGNFIAYASVRNEVTDSSVTELLFELKRMAKEKVTSEELHKIKMVLAGSFGRSLERPETIARFALNTFLYNLPKDYYATYLERLNAVTVAEVQKMAQKYIRPENANILVVGNKDEVGDKLAKFSKNGKVDFYDIYGNPVKAPTNVVDANVTGQSIVGKYIEAIGGKEKLKAVKDMSSTWTIASPQGEIVLTIVQKSPNKIHQTVEAMGMVVQDIKFDGTKGYQSGMQGTGPIEGKELKDLKTQALMFGELEYSKEGYSIELKGIESLYGKDAYKIVVIDPDGGKTTEFYDFESGLKVKSIVTIETAVGSQTQEVEYENYKEKDGIKFPNILATSGQVLKLVDLKINAGVSDEEFKITK